MSTRTESDVIEVLESDAPSRRWTTVVVTAVVPLAYAVLFNVSFRTDENPFDGPDGLTAVVLVALKLLTMAALVVGQHRAGKRITASPSLARVAAGIWAATGAALVVAVALAKNRGASLGIGQLWPGQSDADLLGGLTPGPGPGWNPTSIVSAEIVAVVLLAAVVAMMLRFGGQKLNQQLVTVLSMVSFLGGLFLYDQVIGWPVMFDFDPFVGDAVLGNLTYELAFFVGPIDPLGAVALAVIATANGLIQAWH